MTAMASSYAYSSLANPTSGIRLLSVTSISDGRISASLREVPDLQSEPYHCLSYTWGPATPQTQIICDGHAWLSRQNLHDALVHLHQVLPDKLSAIWIDAICIDQENYAEKGSQLKRMHDIYAGAQSVVVWLGPLPAVPNSATLVSRFEDVALKVAQSFPGVDGLAFFNLMLEVDGGSEAERVSFPLINEISVESWLAVRALVRKEYFRRQWIWQEIVAAKAEPVVVCGAHVLSSWQALRKAAHALLVFGDNVLNRDAAASADLMDPAAQGMSTVNMPHQLAFFRDHYAQQGQPHMRRLFGDLVLRGNRNSYMCWDERDRLFAMMGICGYERLETWEYSRPFEELYLHFWSDVMRRTKDVNFLTYVEDAAAHRCRPRMSKDPDDGGYYAAKIPSWVPDLRAPLEPASMVAFYGVCEWMNVSKGLPSRKDRDETESVSGMVVDEVEGRLRLDGYLFDTIQTSAQSPAQILQMLRDILKDPSTDEDSHEGAIDAVWHSIAVLSKCDVDTNQPVTPEMAAQSHSWFLHNPDFAPQCSVLEMCQKKGLLEEVQALDTANLVFPPQGRMYRRLGIQDSTVLDWAMKRLRLFRTKDHWIGKGPESLKAGDEVWVIPGAKVAFVLRPLDSSPGEGTHTLVGQAYIHGAMSGELHEVLDGREPVEVILV